MLTLAFSADVLDIAFSFVAGYYFIVG